MLRAVLYAGEEILLVRGRVGRSRGAVREVREPGVVFDALTVGQLLVVRCGFERKLLELDRRDGHGIRDWRLEGEGTASASRLLRRLPDGELVRVVRLGLHHGRLGVVERRQLVLLALGVDPFPCSPMSW